jgi:hypothetical protein
LLAQPGTFTDSLTEVLRNGARALLAQAVEAEVAEFLAQHADLKTDGAGDRYLSTDMVCQFRVRTGADRTTATADRDRQRLTRLQSRKHSAHAGDARADQRLVADEPEGEADQESARRSSATVVSHGRPSSFRWSDRFRASIADETRPDNKKMSTDRYNVLRGDTPIHEQLPSPAAAALRLLRQRILTERCCSSIS